jgi:nucleoside-diphosphate-sugar epimerase
MAEGYHVKGSTTTIQKQETLDEAGVESYLIDLNVSVSEKRLSQFLASDILVIDVPPSKINGEMGDYVDRMRMIAVAAAEHQVSKVLFVSSTSVYPRNNQTVDEYTNAFHNHPYFRTTVLRLGGLIGYDRIPHKFLAFVVNQKHAYDRLNLVHRDDATAAMKTVITHAAWDETFNVVANVAPTRKDYYERAAELLNAFPPEMTTDEAPSYKVVSNKKIQTELGFTFQYPDPLAVLDICLADAPH